MSPNENERVLSNIRQVTDRKLFFTLQFILTLITLKYPKICKKFLYYSWPMCNFLVQESQNKKTFNGTEYIATAVNTGISWNLKSPLLFPTNVQFLL